MLDRVSKIDKKKLWRFLPPLSSTVAATILVIGDSVSILCSGFLSYMALIDYHGKQELYVTAVAFVWLVSLILMHFGGLYRHDAVSKPLKFLSGIFVAVITAYFFLLAAAFSIKVAETFSRIWFIAFAASSFVSLIVVRLGFSIAVSKLWGEVASKRSIAILGAGKQCSKLVDVLSHESRQVVQIQGIYDDLMRPDAALEEALPEGVLVRGSLNDLMREARSGLIDDVIIAMPWAEEERIAGAISKLRELPVNIYLGTDLIGYRAQFRKPPSHFGAAPLYQVVGKPVAGWDAVIKAVEDYVLATLILIPIAPLLLLIAIGVWIDSGRPILFRQKRLGFNNEEFEVLKFRTMRCETEPVAVTVQATEDDPRVTRFGKFLRRWSLDELPQLFNVLGGTMSLVGPRPHALDHNDEFSRRTKEYFARHRVKPGITGLAQVRGFRGPTDTDEKLEGRIRSDNVYAENWSLSLDVQILIRTVVVCLFGKHAY